MKTPSLFNLTCLIFAGGIIGSAMNSLQGDTIAGLLWALAILITAKWVEDVDAEDRKLQYEHEERMKLYSQQAESPCPLAANQESSENAH